MKTKLFFIFLTLFFCGCINLIEDEPEYSVKGQVLVPNTETFTLQDVVNAIQWHSPYSGTDLSSCFTNAIPNYFDPSYNNDSYAPANSMKRFRNYGAKNQVVIINTQNWTAPSGVTKIYAMCWGGGASGGGGGTGDYTGGGGGGGGSFISAVGSVTPSSSYTMRVSLTVSGVGQNTNGNDGDYSQVNFDAGQYIRAGGGFHGKSFVSGGSGGSGGTSSKTLGITASLSFAGGNGANAGTFANSGGGGGGAGTTGDGGNASGITGGTGTFAEGGNGGNGTTSISGNGLAGNVAGGGGGGATKTGNSGNGVRGAIIIYY